MLFLVVDERHKVTLWIKKLLGLKTQRWCETVYLTNHSLG